MLVLNNTQQSFTDAAYLNNFFACYNNMYKLVLQFWERYLEGN